MHLPAKVEEVIERKQIQNENDTKLKYFGLYKWDILKAKVTIFTHVSPSCTLEERILRRPNAHQVTEEESQVVYRYNVCEKGGKRAESSLLKKEKCFVSGLAGVQGCIDTSDKVT